jgi:hypothetical protein
MSERPLEQHERWRSEALRLAKAEITGILVDFEVQNCRFAQSADGTTLTISADTIRNHGFFTALQAIILNYADTLTCEVSNVDYLVIRLSDPSPQAKPTIH